MAATFTVRQGDDVMMVTNAGQLIRVPGEQVRLTGRQAMGVTLFRVGAGERVTSVFPVLEDEAEEEAGIEPGAAPVAESGPPEPIDD